MNDRLNDILIKAEREEGLGRNEIAFLLSLGVGGQAEPLYQTARILRRRYFGDNIFLYGFLYLSTYCRNDCRFCFYRRSNAVSVRYRRSTAEIREAAHVLAGSGVHLIDLTMGEDPYSHDGGNQEFSRLVHQVSEVQRVSELPVMVSPGVVSDPNLDDLAQAGVSWYACYQETFNRALFAHLRPGQCFDERLSGKHSALSSGLLVEEGLLCGVGESCGDLTEAVIQMGRLDASQLRVMTFVPQPGTPMANRPRCDFQRELLVMAVMRLVYPQALIPASLDVAGLDGLKSRILAGANVVTSIVPPGLGLAGVAHPALDIAEARRTPSSIQAVLTETQLQVATRSDYQIWLSNEHKRINSDHLRENSLCALP